MTRVIEGECCGSLRPGGNLFKLAVYQAACIAVSAPLIYVGLTDDRQEITGRILGVFIQYPLHFVAPFYFKELSGFAATVYDASVVEVGLA